MLSTYRWVLTIIKFRFSSPSFELTSGYKICHPWAVCWVRESGSSIEMHCLPVYSRTPSQTGWRGWEFVDSIRLIVSLCLSLLIHLSVRKIYNVRAHIFQEDTNQLFKNILASQVPSISSSAHHQDYCQAQMNIRRITSSLIASYTLRLLPSSDNAKRATI